MKSEFGFDKIVVVTRETALDDLVARFNTRDQARFYLEQMGHDFGEIEAAHTTYQNALETLKRALPREVKAQFITRALLPNFVFLPRDLVVVLGPDGLVANAAKYVGAAPILAFNPDPKRNDGVLLPFAVSRAAQVVPLALRGRITQQNVSMAQVETSDGQRMLAFNDLFLGQKTHVAARYSLAWNEGRENQISSGVLVSTGAGSTGWRKSIFRGAFALATRECGESDFSMPLDTQSLAFVVREPFESRVSSAQIVSGVVTRNQNLELTSQMSGGVIFGDGVESDFLTWGEGVRAKVTLARETPKLLV